MLAVEGVQAPEYEQLAVPGEVTALVREMGVEALIAERAKSEEWRKIETLEMALSELPQQTLPLRHIFTDGLYQRSIFMPAGTLLTSRIHLFEHPYILSMGVVSVWSNENGWETIHAFHAGVTSPGTRRIIYVHSDAIWTTTHINPDNGKDPDAIVKRVTHTGGKFAELGASRS